MKKEGGHWNVPLCGLWSFKSTRVWKWSLSFENQVKTQRRRTVKKKTLSKYSLCAHKHIFLDSRTQDSFEYHVSNIPYMALSRTMLHVVIVFVSDPERTTFNDSHCHNIQFNWYFRYVNFFYTVSSLYVDSLNESTFIHNNSAQPSSLVCTTERRW